MDEVNEKIGYLFDVVDQTQEAVVREGFRWNSRGDRMRFFSELSKNLARFVIVTQRPVGLRKIPSTKTAVDDLKNLQRHYGKQIFEQALNELGYDRLQGNRGGSIGG